MSSCIPVHPDWEPWPEPGLWASTPNAGGAAGVDCEKMRCATLTTLLIGVMLYLAMGALVFLTLETPGETSAHEHLMKTKENFLINNSCVTEMDFYNLVKVSVDALSTAACFQYLKIFLFRWIEHIFAFEIFLYFSMVKWDDLCGLNVARLQGVVSAVEAGLDVSSLPANLTSRWDMPSAFFFCGTIITTIGTWQVSFDCVNFKITSRGAF